MANEKDRVGLKNDDPKPQTHPYSRREFLRQTGLAAVGVSLSGITFKQAWAAPSSPMPPHRALTVAGIHAYADKLSVEPGETINFLVSSDTPYTIGISRLGLDPDSPISDVPMTGLLQVDAPSQQPIHPGSYVHVANGLPAAASLTALTLECWVRPRVAAAFAGLITQHDFPDHTGYGLFLSPTGVLFYLGDGGPFVAANLLGTVPTLSTNQWHHVVATWDGATKRLWIDGELKVEQSFAGPVNPGPAPLRLAAYGTGDAGEADRFLNGDLAMPVIYNRALSEAEIKDRYSQKETGVLTPALNGVLACWPLEEEHGDDVADISPFQRLGRIINHATWQIGGPSFDAAVPRFGDYDPTQDPKRGHGLRFASDDLFDCRWQVTQTYTVPDNARSGIYVARLRYPANLEADAYYYHVTFIVRKRDVQQPAPIVLVCPTNTWLAYNSKPFLPKRFVQGSLFKEDYTSTDRRTEPSGMDVPEFSCYLDHQSGAPPSHFGSRLPQPGSDPYVTYGIYTDYYSHLTRATRFTQVWLEREGYAYDVITDLDLHKQPAVLMNYKTVILAGHSEYWSVPAYNGVERYLNTNGNLIVLSGNTMYWRVSFDPDGTVMECRKVDGAGREVEENRRGEAWHSDDGLRGGLMRECGFPGWQVIGLDTFGILSVLGGAPGDAAFGSFHVTTPGHFLFQGLNVEAGQVFSQNLIGHESDVRVKTLEALRTKARNPVPPGATAPVEPPGITTLAEGKGGIVCCDEFKYDYFLGHLPTVDPVAEMIYWERPGGGRVFNAGAIANGVALLNDSVFAGVMRNVLLHFLG